jgi:hypothetical protein
MESKNPLTVEKTITEISIDANCDFKKILQPSDIGRVLPLNTCVILLIDGIKKYVNSTSLIDSFIDGDYDEYEITCISSKNYGWLMIELATLED